jgi:hypothetical protein
VSPYVFFSFSPYLSSLQAAGAGFFSFHLAI